MATLRQIKGKEVTRLIPGKMYIYRYMASSDTKYYNKFPLIFMLRKRKGLYEGIDFHYLAPKERIKLFENMRPFFSTTDIITENTILFAKAFQKIIQISKKFRGAKVSFRKYKKDNIKSKIIEVHPADWLLSLEQPAEMFITNAGKKVNSMLVWKDSLVKQRQ